MTYLPITGGTLSEAQRAFLPIHGSRPLSRNQTLSSLDNGEGLAPLFYALSDLHELQRDGVFDGFFTPRNWLNADCWLEGFEAPAAHKGGQL